MLSNPTCPVCGSADWTTIGRRTYRPIEGGKASAYVRKRLDVLFHVWNDDASEATLSSVLCRRCGFVCYTPRPEEEDIARKYAFLAADATTQHEISQELASDDDRSQALYKRVSQHLSPNAAVLDFGGGNGRLMRAFLAHGLSCSLIDFPGRKIPGLVYLGSRLSDIEDGRKFDLIVCSHVLEHLADPYKAAHALRSYLARGGVFYVEVPLEIWRKAPLPIEPVTHVNYFTVGSLRILLERAGFDVFSCGEGGYTTEDGEPGLAVRALAGLAREETTEIHYGPALADTLRLLQPSLFHQMVRAIKYPSLTRRRSLRFLNQLLAKTPLLWRLVPRSART
jgi:SAM-dependent methyltransferase